MDFRFGESSEAFRGEVREFLTDAVTDEITERMRRTGVSHDAGFVRGLRDRGWICLDWPPQHGGPGRNALEVLPLAEEMQRYGAPTYGLAVTTLVAWVIAEIGSAELKAEILPRVFDTSVLFALGMTEPDCGSDLAAVRTRAVRSGDGWIVNGQKMFTTNAQIADYLFLLARTDPDAPKHAGLTVFLLPLRHDGVEIRPVETLSGERTNIVFLSDVEVDDRLRIGEVGAGWSVMGLTLAREHGLGYAEVSQRLLDHVEQWASTAWDDQPAALHDRDVATRLGRAAAEVEVARLLQHRVAWMQAQGQPCHAQGSMVKLFSTERLQRQAADFMEMLGPDAIRTAEDPGAPAGGEVEMALRHARGTTIYGGTSQIHRNIIAQQVLGLPRAR